MSCSSEVWTTVLRSNSKWKDQRRPLSKRLPRPTGTRSGNTGLIRSPDFLDFPLPTPAHVALTTARVPKDAGQFLPDTHKTALRYHFCFKARHIHDLYLRNHMSFLQLLIKRSSCPGLYVTRFDKCVAKAVGEITSIKMLQFS